MADDQDIPIPLASLPRGYLNPSTQALGKYLAPNLTSYLMSPRSSDPQAQVLPSGKISAFDPRMPGVLSDVGMLGTLPFALEGAPELLGARAASGAAPSAADAVAQAAAAKARSAGQQITDLASNAAGGAPLAGGAGALAATPAAAGEGGSSGRPEFTKEDAARLTQLDKDIAGLTKQKQTAINQVGKSRIQSVSQSYDQQIADKQQEAQKMRDDMRASQERYDLAGQPLAMRDPETVDRIRKGAMALSGGTGAVLGLAGKPILKSLAGGLLEGAAGAYAPTMVDMFKPEDTQAYQMAHHNVWDPHYLANVIAPELGYNTVLAGAGHGVGAAGRAGLTAARDAIAGLFKGSPNASPLAQAIASGQSAAPSASTGGKVWPDRWQDIDMRKDASGNWYEASTGHKIPARLYPPAKGASAASR